MNTAIVFSQRYKKEDQAFVKTLFEVLQKYNYRVFLNGDFIKMLGEDLPEGFSILQEEHVSEASVLITLGGDGTILNATKWLNRESIPILGINLGRMGFLAFTEKNAIDKAISSFVNGEYRLQKRSLLQLESKPGVFSSFPYALNDFTIIKKETSSMITIKTFIDGEYLNTYWADGLIVSTPTGSTGYSLSCGGPIVFPNSGNFVITPIAPHNLNVRPIVIPDTAKISFELEGRTDLFLCTLDSRNETISRHHKLSVKKGDININMVLLHGQSFMKTIRDKLSWGLDIRN